jgi:hypothetical protein
MDKRYEVLLNIELLRRVSHRVVSIGDTNSIPIPRLDEYIHTSGGRYKVIGITYDLDEEKIYINVELA